MKHKKVIVIVAVLVCLAIIGSASGSDKSPTSTQTPAPKDISTEAPVTETDSAAPSIDPTAEPTEEVPTPEPTEKITMYEPGMYKVGKDIPAGEYLIDLTESGAFYGYMQVTKDSSGSFESILSNDNYTGRRYITISKGQYFSFDEGVAIPIKEAPAFKPKDGIYPEGMYKVGKDIKAGEYKIKPTESSAYVEVVKNSSGHFEAIVSNDNITTEKYQTIKKGQYIKIVGAEIIAK